MKGKHALIKNAGCGQEVGMKDGLYSLRVEMGPGWLFGMKRSWEAWPLEMDSYSGPGVIVEVQDKMEIEVIKENMIA